MSIIQDLKWRFATKLFNAEKKISSSDLKTIKEALILTPSSFGLQPWHFLFIKDLKLREKLQPHAWNQPQITTSDTLVAICQRTDIDEKYIQSHLHDIAKTRNIPIESLDGYKQMMEGMLLKDFSKEQLATWAKNQSYIALGNLMTVCANLKIDTCPMEGFDKAKYDEILNLQDKNYITAVLCPIGYRSDDDKYAELAKVRFGEEELITEI